MLDRFKSTTLTWFRTMLGVKTTTSSSPLHFQPTTLPACPENIESYYQKLVAMKEGKGISQLQVICVRAYKSMAPSRHEYVSAIVVDPDSDSKLTYLAIERGRGDPETIPSSGSGDPKPKGDLFSSSNHSIVSLSSVSDSNASHLSAIDKISPMATSSDGMWDEGDELIFELKFDKKCLYLHELAILALLVHKLNTNYLLTTNNCYHYACTIMKVLEIQYETMNTVENSRAGTWCGIIICSMDGNFVSLVEDFRKGIKDFVSSISILNN